MKKLFKRIRYFFLSLKEKRLSKKLKDTLNPRYEAKNKKAVYAMGARLVIDEQTQKLGEFVDKNVREIVEKSKGDVNKLIEYVCTMGTPVFKIDIAEKLLSFAKEEVGFITERRGLTALYLSLITGCGIAFKTKPMFILTMDPDIITVVYSFYLWYSMKSDMPGFDYEAQQMFKKFHSEQSMQLLDKLTIPDILLLKEAISRDKEAIDYAMEYAGQTEITKEVLEKIKNEGGANI